MKDNKDRDEVLAAVKKDGHALKDADESLRKDKEIVLAAVRTNGSALEHADKSLKKDREFVLAAVKKNYYALKYADESLRKDKEIVMAAVKQDGSALEHADKSLKKDREIVLEAVKQNGFALQYAARSLRKDREIVMAAVKKDRLALEYADESPATERCSAEFGVWEEEQEYGTFIVNRDGESEKIEGYIMYGNKSSVTLTWVLPDSADAAIETLEKDEWSDDEIKYDEQEGFESSMGKSADAFDENDNPMGDYDEFLGGGETEVIAFSSMSGPSNITITKKNDKEVVFEPSKGDSWTMKTADGQPQTIPNYKEVLVLVRKLLE